LNRKSKGLLSAIEKRSDWLVANGKPGELAQLACAFAKLDYNAPALFWAIESKWFEIMATGKPQDIYSTRWAFKKLEYPLPAVMELEKIEKERETNDRESLRKQRPTKLYRFKDASGSWHEFPREGDQHG
jgi:hypothetical protein